jgi:putative peptide zinc metalloprotease protein
MTAAEEYFLTGPLEIVASDATQPQCIFVGKRAFHGSQRVANLLRAVAGAAALAAIVDRFNALDGQDMSVEQVRQILASQLLPAGLVATSPPTVVAPPPRKILFLSHTLLSERTVARLTPLFRPLFAAPAAVLAGATATALLGWWLALRLGAGTPLLDPALAMDMTPAESLLFCVLMAATFLLHELGHAAAPSRPGQQPAEIGIGLYLIFPILFSNVTSAWALTRGQRIVVNLGGIYLQGLATACLVPFQLHGGDPVLALTIVLNLLSILVNLNPFFRFDGYWIYSDLFGIPNLRERSRAWAMQRCARWFGSTAITRTEPLALRLYAITAPIFFAGFTIWAAKHAFDFYPAFGAILDRTLHPRAGISSLETLMDAAGVWATLAVYSLGYILSGLYILSSLLRVTLFLRKAAGRPGASANRIGETA